MMLRYLYIVIAGILFLTQSQAQMWNGTDTIYGPEWIPDDRPVYHFRISDQGWYRITAQDLNLLGDNEFLIDQVRLIRNGQEVSLYRSGEGVMSEEDYILFYNPRKDGSLDRHLYRSPDQEMLNPAVSLFGDSSSYYLYLSDEPTGKSYTHQQFSLDDHEAPAEVSASAQIIHDQNHSQNYRLFDNVPLSFSQMDLIEGFGSGFMGRLNFPLEENLEIHNLIDSGQARLEMRLGSNHAAHQLEIHWNQELVYSEAFSGTRLLQPEILLPTESLLTINTLSIEGKASSQDRYSLATAILTYPCAALFQTDKNQLLSADSTSQGRIQVEGSTEDLVFDLENDLYWIPQSTTDGENFISIQSGASRRLSCSFESERRSIPALKEVNIIHPQEIEGNYLFIVGNALYQSETVRNYAEYRASPTGGNFTTSIVNMEDLAHLYAYGDQRNPIAIRNFVHHLKKLGKDIEYSLLIGKARDYKDIRHDHGGQLACLVPTMGSPGSDNLLFASNTSNTPIIPFGRLAVETEEELKAYLDKLIEHESQQQSAENYEDRAWRKKVMHLIGGEEEAPSIRLQMNVLSNAIRNNGYGAEVISYDKEMSEAVQNSLSSQIIADFNRGVGIKTFFGHGAVNTTDFGLDDPELFNNRGRYPLIISLGCLSGNLHTNIKSVSEKFILAEDKGGIAYLASSGFGFISALRRLCSTTYGALGGDYYTAGVGDLLQKTLAEHELDQSLGIQLLKEQFTLHGDPAVRIHLEDGPDFTFDQRSAKVENEIVNAEMEAFEFSVELINLGKDLVDSLDLLIEMDIPGRTERYSDLRRVAFTGFRQKISIELPLYGQESVGKNTIYITADPNNKITEFPTQIGENNNSLINDSGEQGYDLLILNNKMEYLFPQNYSIHGEDTVQFRALVSRSLGAGQGYTFQLDTTPLFQSPELQTQDLYSEGGLLSWTASSLIPELVYYWRLLPKADSVSAIDVHSFRYDPSLGSGWSQSHYYQFLEDDFHQMRLDSNRRFTMDQKSNFFQLNSFTSQAPDYIERSTLFMNNERLARMVGFGPVSPSRSKILVVVQDPLSMETWKNPANGAYGSVNINAETSVFYFPVHTSALRQNLIRFLRDTIPSGHYVHILAGVWDDDPMNCEDWRSDDSTAIGTNLFSVLENQGATEISVLETRGTVPFLFSYQKDEGPLLEKIADDRSQRLIETLDIKNPLSHGSISYGRIGPALGSKTIDISYEAQEDVRPQLVIKGYDDAQSDEALIYQGQAQSINLDTTALRDAQYLSLSLQTHDSIQRRATQLHHWHLISERATDLSVDPGHCLEGIPDLVPRGQDLHFSLGVKNIGYQVSDSFTVEYTLRDELNRTLRWEEKYAGLDLDEKLCLETTFETEELSGSTQFSLRINPDFAFAEEHYQNNFYLQKFDIVEEQTNPLLTVSFDGRALEDYGIVSREPQIAVGLLDDNPYLLLDDISLLDLLLTDPEGQELDIDNLIVDVRYPDSTRNELVIYLRPTLTLDGFYRLEVNGTDRSGNSAGDEPYAIHFRYEANQGLSPLKAAPNPTNGLVRFSYYYTGTEQPQSFQIDIYNTSGQRVTEISAADFGTLYGGYNTSSYVLDLNALDLPAGLYFYTVSARDRNGNPLRTVHPDSSFRERGNSSFYYFPDE